MNILNKPAFPFHAEFSKQVHFIVITPFSVVQISKVPLYQKILSLILQKYHIVPYTANVQYQPGAQHTSISLPMNHCMILNDQQQTRFCYMSECVFECLCVHGRLIGFLKKCLCSLPSQKLLHLTSRSA